jgi:hypothetical protein
MVVLGLGWNRVMDGIELWDGFLQVLSILKIWTDLEIVQMFCNCVIASLDLIRAFLLFPGMLRSILTIRYNGECFPGPGKVVISIRDILGFRLR